MLSQFQYIHVWTIDCGTISEVLLFDISILVRKRQTYALNSLITKITLVFHSTILLLPTAETPGEERLECPAVQYPRNRIYCRVDSWQWQMKCSEIFSFLLPNAWFGRMCACLLQKLRTNAPKRIPVSFLEIVHGLLPTKNKSIIQKLLSCFPSFFFWQHNTLSPWSISPLHYLESTVPRI